jgi:hypothetical protein
VACVRYDLGADSTVWTVTMKLGTTAGASDTALTSRIRANATRPAWFCFPPASTVLACNSTYYVTVVATTECSEMAVSATTNGFLFDTLPPVAVFAMLRLYDGEVSPVYAWENDAGVSLPSLNSSIAGDWNVSWPAGTIVGECGCVVGVPSPCPCSWAAVWLDTARVPLCSSLVRGSE